MRAASPTSRRRRYAAVALLAAGVSFGVSALWGASPALAQGGPAYEPAHVGSIEVEVGSAPQYTRPILHTNGFNGYCKVVRDLYRVDDGGTETKVGSTHNGFRVTTGGLHQVWLVGEAQEVAPERRYKLVYRCRQSSAWVWQASYTIDIKVVKRDFRFEAKADELLVAGRAVTIAAAKAKNPDRTVSYSLASQPALPAGLTFDASTGAISGTPTATQPRRVYTVTGTDRSGRKRSYSFGIEVRKLVWSSTPASVSVDVGEALSVAPSLTGAIGNVEYDVFPDASQLPPGVSFDASTGAISGTPTAAYAAKSFTVHAHDNRQGGWSSGFSQTASYTVEISVGEPPPTEPVLSVAAGSAVTEGTAATFTITASPSATSAVTVSYTVAQSGDYVVSGGTGSGKTVSLSGGSVTVTVATDDDSADESDGSVTVTLGAGTGYSVGSPGSATVNVSDDDDPPPTQPVLSVAAGSAVTEGGAASFTISADPSAASQITVNYTVTQSGSYVTSGDRGSQTVALSGGSVTVTVATDDDSADESDGSVTVTLGAGTGYSVGSPGSATVNVSDDDDPPPTQPVLSVAAGSAVTEGGAASFTISADPSAASQITVNYTVTQSGSYVTSGDRGSQTVALSGGSVTVTVATDDDSADESDGSVTVTLGAGTGYSVGSPGSATVNVSDDDDPPPAQPGGGGAPSLGPGGPSASDPGTAEPAAQPAGFVDVDASSVHAASIGALFAAGVTVGCGAEPLRFCPDRAVSRAEMASFLVRALDLDQA